MGRLANKMLKSGVLTRETMDTEFHQVDGLGSVEMVTSGEYVVLWQKGYDGLWRDSKFNPGNVEEGCKKVDAEGKRIFYRESELPPDFQPFSTSNYEFACWSPTCSKRLRDLNALNSHMRGFHFRDYEDMGWKEEIGEMMREERDERREEIRKRLGKSDRRTRARSLAGEEDESTDATV